MKKVLYLISFLFCSFLPCFASDIDEVQNFFNNYVNAANTYSSSYFDFYTSDAKIYRVVEKDNGGEETVQVPLSRYKSETKKSRFLAKMRKYKNKYFNVKVSPHGDDYIVNAMRKPSTSDYKIPAHFIIGKDNNGAWKIKEESMNTKVQTFLTAN